MKKQVQLALAGAAIGVMSLVAVTHSASAQQAPFVKLARGVNTWMARAMEDCTSPTITVSTVGSPTSGCLQANGDLTDDTMTMATARVNVVNSTGKIALRGTGFQFGDTLRVHLKLRITKQGVGTPGGPKNITFGDVTVECPQAPDAFPVRPNGAVIGSTTLAACLSPNSLPGCTTPSSCTGLATGNIEVLDLSLVNAVTGQIVAVPGVLR
jgi:hypothetical protein